MIDKLTHKINAFSIFYMLAFLYSFENTMHFENTHSNAMKICTAIAV